MPKVYVALCLTILLVAAAVVPVAAQDATVYIVQPGDTLTRIALRFNVTTAELALANGLSNPNLIVVGQRLTIPGGSPAPTPSPAASNPGATLTYSVQPGDTLFRIATRHNVSVEALAAANALTNVDLIYVGQQLVIPPPASTPAANLPAPFAAIKFSHAPAIQGHTVVAYVTLDQPASLTGDFEGRPLFFNGDGQSYWTVFGIHALADPGVYSLALRATLSDGRQVATAQNVVVAAGPYGLENIALQPGRESLLDNDLIQAEFAQVSAVWSRVTPRPLWEGPFRLPLDANRLTSQFGTRRSYNGGPVGGFHAGTDFGAGTGTPIYAPAAGVVVLAEQLAVRGNAVIIDHGMGLFSGYWHQSAIAVTTGQTVQPGDLIGYVGDTGLVTGAHLHWEMRLGGVAVEPLQWTEEVIP